MMLREGTDLNEDRIIISVNEVLHAPQFTNKDKNEDFREVKIQLFTRKQSIKLNIPFKPHFSDNSRRLIRFDTTGNIFNYELNSSETIRIETNDYLLINFDNNQYNFIEISYIEKFNRIKSLKFWKGYKNNIILPFLGLNHVNIIKLRINLPKGMKLDKSKIIPKSSLIKKSNDFFNYILKIKGYVDGLNITYTVIPDLNLIFFGSTIVAIILILYSVNSILKIIFDQCSKMPEIGLLLALFSLSALIIQLKREKYQITGYRFLLVSMGITLITILLILLIYFIFLLFAVNHC